MSVCSTQPLVPVWPGQQGGAQAAGKILNNPAGCSGASYTLSLQRLISGTWTTVTTRNGVSTPGIYYGSEYPCYGSYYRSVMNGTASSSTFC